MDEKGLKELLDCHAPEAIDRIVETYGTRLLQTAFLLCGNKSDAEDVTQETFLTFSRTIDKFRGDSSIYTWLHAILRNTAYHYRRKSTRLVFTEFVPEQDSGQPEPGQALDSAVTSRVISKALKSLALEHREILILRYYESLTIEEISTQLGINKGTAKSRLFYARQQLSVLLPESLNPFNPAGH